eukprot:5315734-Alexandrium_andersonii.AAC.1
MQLAFSKALLGSIPDGRAMPRSVFALTIGKIQDMGDMEYGRIFDVCLPPSCLQLFDGPACS